LRNSPLHSEPGKTKYVNQKNEKKTPSGENGMVNAFDDSAPTEICRLEIVGANAKNPKARTLPYGYAMRAGPPLCPTITSSFSKGFPTSCVTVLTRPSGICPNDCTSVDAQSRMQSSLSPAKISETCETKFYSQWSSNFWPQHPQVRSEEYPWKMATNPRVLLHETGCHPEQLERIRELNQKHPEGPNTKQ
jgi:hypothetical protein